MTAVVHISVNANGVTTVDFGEPIFGSYTLKTANKGPLFGAAFSFAMHPILQNG